MMIERTFTQGLIFIIALSFLVGCSSSGSDVPVTVVIKPNPFRIPNGGTVQFSAEVSGTLQKGVTWSMTGAGSLDPQTGRYTAAIVGQLRSATIIATSTDDTSAAGIANVTITDFNQLQGEKLAARFDALAVGGAFVNGQTVELNGDGFLDLLARSVTAGELTFFGGQGNEKFVTKSISINDPVAMIAGDFVIGDFLSDVAVAVANGADEKIVFYQAQKKSWETQGAPSAADEIIISPRRPISLAAGRFHDSHLVAFPISDLIVGAENNNVIFFRQDRSKSPFTFSEEASFPVGGRPIQMLTDDFNQDTWLDLVVVREGLRDALILFGDGDGGFPSSGTVAFPDPPTFLAKGFFNADDSVDLVAAHAASKQISVVLGQSDGSFGAAKTFATASAPGTLTIGDFNVGSHEDIAVALPDSNAIYILFGDGAGNFVGDWRYDTGTLSPAALISGFFTGFQAPQGFQSVELVYLGINPGAAPPSDQFFLLSNRNF